MLFISNTISKSFLSHLRNVMSQVRGHISLLTLQSSFTENQTHKICLNSQDTGEKQDSLPTTGHQRGDITLAYIHCDLFGPHHPLSSCRTS